MSETGDPGSPSGGEGGGGSFWTSGPALMTAAAMLVTAVVTGVVTLHDEFGDDGDDGDDQAVAVGSTGETAETETTSSSSRFREETPSLGRVYFEGEMMLVESTARGNPMVAIAEGDHARGDVEVSVRAGRHSGSSDYGVGLICRYENANNYYLLSLLSKGEFRVIRYRRGKRKELAHGPVSTIASGAHDLTARCVGQDPTNLTLSVDGRTVAAKEDSDDGIAQGGVGVRVGSDDPPVTCWFESFRARPL